MFRFFVSEKLDKEFILSKEVLQHLKVVRAEKEEFICIYEKQFYVCILENKLAKIIKEINENHEFAEEVILAAGIIETKNWEFMIQKATELGATKVIPVYSENVSKKIPDIQAKLERWNKIAINASEQSFRNKPLEVTMPMSFDDVIKLPIANKFIAHEKKHSDVNDSYPQNSLFLIGPEGGFSEAEVTKAIENKFQAISLGKRILRAETASLFVLAKVVQL